MTQIMIPTQVVNGHLQHEKSLAELEGQHVLATLTVVPTAGANETNVPPSPKSQESNDFAPGPPPWLEVEQDLYFPMTHAAKSLGEVKIRQRRGKPCIILPENLPDE